MWNWQQTPHRGTWSTWATSLVIVPTGPGFGYANMSPLWSISLVTTKWEWQKMCSPKHCCQIRKHWQIHTASVATAKLKMAEPADLSHFELSQADKLAHSQKWLSLAQEL